MYPGISSGRSGGSNVDYLLQGCNTYKSEFRMRISKDVNEVLSLHSSLKVETEVYYNNDGTSQTLLVLNGTIPIFYGGAQYNIPMSFWITKDYPVTAPLAYVTPTSTMQIARNHDYVAPDGAVFLPYLNQWSPSRSNLNGLISICKSVFSNFPPVIGRSPSQSTPEPPRPPPAYGAYSSGGASTPPPPGPPPPSAHGSTPYPTAMPVGGGAGQTPPPPPYPVGSSSSSSGTGMYPSGTPPPPAASMVRRTSEDEKRQAAQKKEQEKKMAKQAVAVKLQEEYRRFREQMKDELKQHMETQKKLEEGEKTLKDTIGRLDKQQSDFENAIVELKTKTTQLETWLAEYETKNGGSDDAMAQISLDEAIVPADAPSRQMFDCVAESSAIDDILYHLDRALTNDAVDLTTFLKEVRKLARKQFMSKALAKKIQKHQQKVEMQNRHQPPLNSMPPAYHTTAYR